MSPDELLVCFDGRPLAVYGVPITAGKFAKDVGKQRGHEPEEMFEYRDASGRPRWLVRPFTREVLEYSEEESARATELA